MEKCHSCHLPVEAGARFCESCGTPVLKAAKKPAKKKICPKCRKLVDAQAVFCEECGNAIRKKGWTVKARLLRLGLVAAVVLSIVFIFAERFQRDEVEVTQRLEEVSTEGTVSEGTDPEGAVEQTEWREEPFTVTKHNVELYSNEAGGVEFTGYTIDESGNYTIVLKYTGLLVNDNFYEPQHTIILADGTSVNLQNSVNQEVRLTDQEKYRIFQGYSGSTAAIIRVDTEWFYDSDTGMNQTFAEITEVKGTIDIAGTKNLATKKKFSPITRENDNMTVTLKSIAHEISSATGEKDEFTFYWVIKPKRDLERSLALYAKHPKLSYYSTVDQEIKKFFKGTTVEYSNSFTASARLSKDGVHTLYFYLDTELFGFNLNNYKELKEVPLTHFLQELNPLIKPTINGFVDVAGERVYDAIQTKQLRYSEKSNADFGQAIPVGGFKQLRFRLGAGKAENPANQPYTVTIFGEDYYKAGSYREKNEAATVLFEEKITNDTALKQHTVKLDGHRVIYLEIDNYNNKENQHLEPYPVILEGLNALK